MTLFAAASTYAPGETSGVVLPPSQYQNMGYFGRWHLGNLKSPNVVLGVIGLVIAAWLAHRYLHVGRRR